MGEFGEMRKSFTTVTVSVNLNPAVDHVITCKVCPAYINTVQNGKFSGVI